MLDFLFMRLELIKDKARKLRHRLFHVSPEVHAQSSNTVNSNVVKVDGYVLRSRAQSGYYFAVTYRALLYVRGIVWSCCIGQTCVYDP